MPLYKTQAIVLEATDFGEADKIVTFFSKDFGKFKGIAKAAKKSKKRFGSSLDLLSYINLEFFEKGNEGLTWINNCSLIEPHLEIRKNLEKISYGGYFLELVKEMLGERERNEEIFKLLVYFLSLINYQKPMESMTRIFEIKLLSLLGYQPQLEKCSVCSNFLGSSQVNYFSLEKGGTVCNNCSYALRDFIPISLGTSRLLLKAQNLAYEKLHRLIFSPQALKESREILPGFIQYQLGKRLKSLEFMEGMGVAQD